MISTSVLFGREVTEKKRMLRLNKGGTLLFLGREKEAEYVVGTELPRVCLRLMGVTGMQEGRRESPAAYKTVTNSGNSLLMTSASINHISFEELEEPLETRV